MSTLEIYLLGQLQIRHKHTPLPPLPTQKGRSLLAYLALHPNQDFPRPLLVGLLWPDAPERQGRRALSQTLWQLRRTLDSAAGRLVTSEDCICFNLHTTDYVDTQAFQTACTPPPAANPSAEIEQLQRAVDLYRGDLLEGLYDDWVLLEREQLRQRYLAAMERLIDLYKQWGNYQQALHYARQLVLADSLHEEAHCDLMRLYHLLGHHRAALEQYQTLRRILTTELGVEPMNSTTLLAQEIAVRLNQTQPPYLPPGLSPAPVFENPDLIPLVGREEERAALLTYLEAAIGGRGGLMLVEGEAGVGKTRLLQELVRDAEWRSAQVGWGRGRELVNPPPYGVLREALHATLSPLRANQLAELVEGVWLREVSLVLPKLTEWLPNLPPHIELSPEQQQARLFEALTQTVLALGRIAPHLLILDDLQWADETSLSALTHLAPWLAGSRMFIISSYRSEDARKQSDIWKALQTLDRIGGRRRLLLGPLTADRTRELVRRGLGLVAGFPLFEAQLHQETGGNPLFVLETLRVLHDEGLLYRNKSGEWSAPWDETTFNYVPLPTRVGQVITRRLTHLGANERAVLNVAAVLGSDFSFTLLARVSNLDQSALLAATSDLLQRRLLVEGPAVYHFSHDKVRQVAYREIEEAEQRRLHRQAGWALEMLHPEQVEQLARHFSLGQVWDQALAYTLQAGQQAYTLYDNQSAMAHYEQALVLAGNDPVSRWNVLLQQESILDVLCRREAQVEILSEMWRLAKTLNDPARQARARYRQGELELLIGSPQQSLILLDEAAKLARSSGEHSLLGHCLIATARAHWRMYDGPRCQMVAEEAQALFHEAGDWVGEGRVLNMLGNLHLGLTGDYGQALTYFEEYRRLGYKYGDQYLQSLAQINAGHARFVLGDYRRALELINDIMPFITRIADPFREGLARFCRADCYRELGDLPKAQEAAQKALSIFREIGDTNFEMEVLIVWGSIAISQKAYHDAKDCFAQALELAQANKQSWDTTLFRSHLALVLLRLGKTEEAHRLSVQVMAELKCMEKPMTQLHTIYFECYQVFTAVKGLKRAHPYLERAYQTLLAAAERIRDTGLRRSFLENVTENRAILTAYRLGRPPSPLWQQVARLPVAGAPTGRPLRDDEWVEITWTVTSPEDDEISGKIARRQHRLLRLLREAAAQSATPTVPDLASALAVGNRTIERDLASLRVAGHETRTRGSHASPKNKPSS